MKPLLLFCLLVLLSSYDQPIKTFSPAKKDCFSGKWGNDFVLCGDDRIGKSGKGKKDKRDKEELWLTFKGKDKGEFSFYDCRNKKRYKDGIPFTYTVNADTLKFNWVGTPEEVRLSTITFQFKTAYRFECKEDTLAFVDGLMQNTLYDGATYFVNRK